MDTATEEVTVDLDAEDSKRVAKDSGNEADVVVDREISAKTDKNDVVTPEQGLEKLQKQLTQEREARQAADQRANEAARGEAAAKTEVQSTQLDLIKAAIGRATELKASLKKDYAAAAAAGDWDAAAEVQSKMSDNAADLSDLQRGKTRIENAPKPAPRASVDPVEVYITNGQLSQRAAAWVRAHPQFARDSKGQQRLLHAHHAALAEGHDVESPEYFKSVEMILKVHPDDAARHLPEHHDDPPARAPEAETASEAVGGRQTAPAAAPVTRSGNGAGGRPNIVKLSSEEVEIARASFPDSKDPLGDYARQKVALKKEGKLS